MKSKIVEYLLCALILFGGLGFIVHLIYPYLPNRPAPRAEMRHFVSRVPLNTTRTQFKKQFAVGKYQHLKLSSQGSKSWRVSTPLEIGAENWVLYADFQGENLVALRMRTSDDSRFRPRDKAPADKVRRLGSNLFRILNKDVCT